jgi:radical SAM protein with 4Fe4S-binding SPASM domain
MPTWKILELLDEAKELGFNGRVGFYHYSEPLLDKRNVMLAQEAKKRHMRPYLHTNGDALRHDSKLCEQVKETYELIVVGLYDYKTNDELNQAKGYWQERLRGTNLKFSAIGIEGRRTAYSMGIPKALVPSDSRMVVPDLLYPNGPCHRPLIRMIIQYDGAMCNCCEDTHGAFNLGNVYQSSMEKLWFSEYHIEIVKNLVSGQRKKYSLCMKCPLSPTGPAANGEKIEIHRRKRVVEAPLPE